MIWPTLKNFSDSIESSQTLFTRLSQLPDTYRISLVEVLTKSLDGGCRSYFYRTCIRVVKLRPAPRRPYLKRILHTEELTKAVVEKFHCLEKQFRWLTTTRVPLKKNPFRWLKITRVPRTSSATTTRCCRPDRPESSAVLVGKLSSLEGLAVPRYAAPFELRNLPSRNDHRSTYVNRQTRSL